MKLIIDIPENLYETINNDKYGVHEGRIYDIIRNGIPLNDNYIVPNEYVDYQDRVGADMMRGECR